MLLRAKIVKPKRANTPITVDLMVSQHAWDLTHVVLVVIEKTVTSFPLQDRLRGNLAQENAHPLRTPLGP